MTFLRSPKQAALGITIAIALLGTHTAQAFSDDEARRAILELREQVRQTNEQTRRIHLDFADQLDILKQEIRSLRGQLEQLKWLSEVGSTAQGAAPSTNAADPQEQAAYENPINQFKNGQYAAAITGFNTFIDAYPESSLAPDAYFYRGSSQYATKAFKASIQGLEEFIQNHPKHSKAPDALLIIAASQIELDNLSGAKTTLQRITKNYPDSSAAQTAKERLKLL